MNQCQDKFRAHTMPHWTVYSWSRIHHADHTTKCSARNDCQHVELSPKNGTFHTLGDNFYNAFQPETGSYFNRSNHLLWVSGWNLTLPSGWQSHPSSSGDVRWAFQLRSGEKDGPGLLALGSPGFSLRHHLDPLGFKNDLTVARMVFS